MSKSRTDLIEALPHWGSLKPDRELAGGNRNQVLLVLRGAEKLVAKSTERCEAAVCWLVETQRIAEAVGLVVPRYVAGKDGRYVQRGVTVERFLEGERPVPADRAAIARLVQAFHERSRGRAQRPGFAASSALLQASRGGDVNLDLLPQALVARCRQTWQPLTRLSQSVVHGDLHRDNILKLADGRFALIDWDEARVDVSLLDMAALFDVNPGYPDELWRQLLLALDAWEVAVSWEREPAYARRRAAHLLTRMENADG